MGKLKHLQNIKRKSSVMTKHTQARICTHEGTTISFINQSIQVIHRLGAAWLEAARRCSRIDYTVRIRHKGIPPCRQRQACCIAMSLACRRLVPLGNLTPSMCTSEQWDNVVLDPSRSLPLCAPITNLACIVATTRPLFGLRGVANSSALLFSPSSHTSSATFSAASVQGRGSAEKHA